MSLNQQLIEIKKNDDIIRQTVLLNITKMLVERKLLNNSKIEYYENKFKTATLDDTYIIDIDKEITPDNNDEKYINNLKKKQIVIKIISQKIMGKVPVVTDFLELYKYNHKILIVDSITDKTKYFIIKNTPNTEVFIESFFMINIIDHIDSPKYEILSDNDNNTFLNSYNLKKKQLPKMLTTDPISYYFNLKRGQIVRIIRSSEQTGIAISYRIIANSSL